jgi:hypothetical protein
LKICISVFLLSTSLAYGCVKKKALLQSVKRNEQTGEVSLEWKEFVATKNGRSVRIVLHDIIHVATPAFYDKSLGLMTELVAQSARTALIAEGIKCGLPQDEVYVIDNTEAFQEGTIRLSESGFNSIEVNIDTTSLMKSGFFKKKTCDETEASKSNGSINQGHENTANKTGNVSQIQYWAPGVVRLKNEGKLDIEKADITKSALSINDQMMFELAIFKETNPNSKFAAWLSTSEGKASRSHANELMKMDARNRSWISRLTELADGAKYDALIVPWGINHFIGIQPKLETTFTAKGWEIRLDKTVPLDFVNCNLKNADEDLKKRNLILCMSLAFNEDSQRIEDSKTLIVPKLVTTARLKKAAQPEIDVKIEGTLAYSGPQFAGICLVNAVFGSPHSLSASNFKKFQSIPVRLAEVKLKSNDSISITQSHTWKLPAQIFEGPLVTKLYVKCGKTNPSLLSSHEVQVVR